MCKCAASDNFRRMSGLSSSGIFPLAAHVVSSIGDVASGVTGVSGLNSVGEDRTTMFKTYRGPLPIHLRWYELHSGTCRSGDLSAVERCNEQHHMCDTIRLCKDTMQGLRWSLAILMFVHHLNRS